MKRKLTLQRATLRRLTGSRLGAVLGGLDSKTELPDLEVDVPGSQTGAGTDPRTEAKSATPKACNYEGDITNH